MTPFSRDYSAELFLSFGDRCARNGWELCSRNGIGASLGNFVFRNYSAARATDTTSLCTKLTSPSPLGERVPKAGEGLLGVFFFRGSLREKWVGALRRKSDWRFAWKWTTGNYVYCERRRCDTYRQGYRCRTFGAPFTSCIFITALTDRPFKCRTFGAPQPPVFPVFLPQDLTSEATLKPYDLSALAKC